MSFRNLKLSIFFKKELIILYFIVIIGSILRFQGVWTNSFAFTYDVGRDMLALWNIVHIHKIPLIGQTTGIPGVFYGPWWYYMLTPFFVIFSGNPQGIALVMALIGISSIILAYLFGKRIGNSFLGIVMAILVGISPSMVSTSSQIWNPNVAPFLALLTLIVLERIYVLRKKAKPIYFLILGALLMLNADIEILWGILFTIGILLSLFLILRKQVTIKQIIFLVIGGLIILLPRIVFELRHGFIMSKSFIAFFSAKTLEDKLDFYHFLENRALVHFGEFSKSFMSQGGYLALALLIFIVISISLFYRKGPKIIKNLVLTSFITILVFYVGSIVFSHALWSHYFVGLPVIYIFLLSASLFLISKKIKNNYVGIAILIVLFALNIKGSSIIRNFQKPLWEGDASVYRNELSIIDYVYGQAKGKPFKYVLYTPPVHDYTYQYLFKWYGPLKYNYAPSVKAPLAFFIIEPDPGYPDRPKWFLEARVKDGKIIKSKTVKAGIVVQTRDVR